MPLFSACTLCSHSHSQRSGTLLPMGFLLRTEPGSPSDYCVGSTLVIHPLARLVSPTGSCQATALSLVIF